MKRKFPLVPVFSRLAERNGYLTDGDNNVIIIKIKY